VRLIGARRALEVGTFTGYSALCIAGPLPPHSELIACETNEDGCGLPGRCWQDASPTTIGAGTMLARKR
jgi:predicted O-methyltransferase YrrM